VVPNNGIYPHRERDFPASQLAEQSRAGRILFLFMNTLNRWLNGCPKARSKAHLTIEQALSGDKSCKFGVLRRRNLPFVFPV
jgi:hypothetical protein